MLTKKNIFWILVILIAVVIGLIFFEIGNIDIEVGLLSGLIVGLIMGILSWFGE